MYNPSARGKKRVIVIWTVYCREMQQKIIVAYILEMQLFLLFVLSGYSGVDGVKGSRGK